ncbi:exodeoxyribonuclease VII small subunit [Vagococcus sp.]|uniref:exodeoxyribonuclease VII small subunit n=1 Tax=Vagococcus sp. TaxID=1933889 RepID=UPI003F9605F6
MTDKNKSFESSLAELEEIVKLLEMGEVPLEEALDKFKQGIELSKTCQKTLEEAEKTLTKMMTDDNQEVPFENEGE